MSHRPYILQYQGRSLGISSRGARFSPTIQNFRNFTKFGKFLGGGGGLPPPQATALNIYFFRRCTRCSTMRRRICDCTSSCLFECSRPCDSVLDSCETCHSSSNRRRLSDPVIFTNQEPSSFSDGMCLDLNCINTYIIILHKCLVF